MMRKGYDSLLLSSLDEIAWVLNIRASDIEYNPYCIFYLLISQESVRWFVRKGETVDADTADSFDELGIDEVSIENYDALAGAMDSISSEDIKFVDSASLNWHYYSILNDVYTGPGSVRLVCGQSPVALMKAVKNPREIELLRETIIEDGLAVERFIKWTEDSIDAAERGERAFVDEWEALKKLHSLREGIDGFRGDCPVHGRIPERDCRLSVRCTGAGTSMESPPQFRPRDRSRSGLLSRSS